MMDMLMKFLPLVLALAVMIVAAVNLGSLNTLKDDKKLEEVTEWKNARNTSVLLLLISLALMAYFGYDLYSKKDSLFAKNFIYYF
jgi:hypothetical protein